MAFKSVRDYQTGDAAADMLNRSWRDGPVHRVLLTYVVYFMVANIQMFLNKKLFVEPFLYTRSYALSHALWRNTCQ